MGRSWQFFLTVAVVATIMGYLYYSSDFYAKRAAGETSAPATAQGAEAPAPAGSEQGIIPSNE